MPEEKVEPRAEQGSRRASDDSDSSSWVDYVRNGALIVVLLVMLWLAFNVRLPSIEEIRDGADTTSWMSRVSFVGMYALVALTPIPVSIMALAAGLLFGVIEGTILSLIGVFLGCWGAYWIARALGKETVRRLLGKHSETVEDKLVDRGFMAVFMLRLMPGIPYWPVNYGGGAFGIAQREYVTSTALAVIPGQLSLVAIGAFIAHPTFFHGAVAVIAWIAVIGLTIWSYRGWRKQREDKKGGAKTAENQQESSSAQEVEQEQA